MHGIILDSIKVRSSTICLLLLRSLIPNFCLETVNATFIVPGEAVSDQQQPVHHRGGRPANHNSHLDLSPFWGLASAKTPKNGWWVQMIRLPFRAIWADFQVRTLSFREGTDEKIKFQLQFKPWFSNCPLAEWVDSNLLICTWNSKQLNGCLVKASIFYIKIWNHQIETIIYTWMYQIPGINGINYLLLLEELLHQLECIKPHE